MMMKAALKVMVGLSVGAAIGATGILVGMVYTAAVVLTSPTVFECVEKNHKEVQEALAEKKEAE